MSVANWPSLLPRPDRSSWQLSPQDMRVGRNPDAGPPEWRRRFSGKIRNVSMAILLDADQRAIFWDFFERTLKDGTLPFRMTNPASDGWALATGDGAPILTSGNVPIAIASQWLCKFGQALPAETIRGTSFQIAFSVVVLP